MICCGAGPCPANHSIVEAGGQKHLIAENHFREFFAKLLSLGRIFGFQKTVREVEERDSPLLIAGVLNRASIAHTLLNAHVHDVEREAFWRKGADGIWRHAGPRLISGVADLRVQVEQELVGEAFERRRLAEREA